MACRRSRRPKPGPARGSAARRGPAGHRRRAGRTPAKTAVTSGDAGRAAGTCSRSRSAGSASRGRVKYSPSTTQGVVTGQPVLARARPGTRPAARRSTRSTVACHLAVGGRRVADEADLLVAELKQMLASPPSRRRSCRRARTPAPPKRGFSTSTTTTPAAMDQRDVARVDRLGEDDGVHPLGEERVDAGSLVLGRAARVVDKHVVARARWRHARRRARPRRRTGSAASRAAAPRSSWCAALQPRGDGVETETLLAASPPRRRRRVASET